VVVKEISCRVFLFFCQILQQKGHSIEPLFEGTGLTKESLRDKNERFSWETYRKVERNFVKCFVQDENRLGSSKEDQLIEIGGTFPISPHLLPLSIIPRMLFKVRDLYYWIFKPVTGAGAQLFSCVEPSIRDLDGSTLLLEMRLTDGYVASREFFTISLGCLINFPRVLGLPPSTVTMELVPWGARYVVKYPQGGGHLSSLTRSVSWLFTARAAARELKDANEVLTDRYYQLESAKQQLSEQEMRLKTAYAVNQLIRGDLDFDRMVDAVAQSLVSEAGFLAARVSIDSELDNRTFQRIAERGTPFDENVLSHDVERRGRAIGIVQVWYRPEEYPNERRDLLAFIIPTISIALDEAITYTALADYRQNLEQKVIERTQELTEARDHLAATVEKLKRSEQARNRMFANINHDIRTPLSLITLAASDLKRRYGAQFDARATSGLAGIDQSVKKLLRLIDGMLLLAAGQESKLQLQVQTCDVGALLTALSTTWGLVAKEHSLTLTYDGPSECVIKADQQALERMVTNFLSNAIKFTPSGGRIEVGLREHDGGVDISVRDTGVGIDDEFKSRVFGRFEQGRSAVRPGVSGSGIGLSIVKELAEAHGGRVGVENAAGGGAHFHIWLPLVSKAGALPVSNEGGRVLSPSPSVSPAHYGLVSPNASIRSEVIGRSGAPTILIAEDDPELRRGLIDLLAPDYRLLTATEGMEALRLAEQYRPDLLVSDVVMPGIDGFELTRQYRKLFGNRLSPVLLLTAREGLGDRLSGFDAGAVDYVTKPFEPEELLARIHSQLELRSMALKLHQSEQLAMLGSLSAGLAHEMRNPANAIVNAVPPLMELLPKELLVKDQPVEQLIGVIRECADQIGLLSRQLLGFKRSGELEPEKHQVTTLIQRCITLATHTLREVELRTDFQYDGTAMVASPLFVQLMTNLLENAAHAAGAGGWIGLATRANVDRLIVEISDSGPGVPPTLRDRIFEPFFTTKSPGLGTGLGLTTAREIAIRHGGSLEVRDTHAGSLFRLELPIHPTSEAASISL
jgi:signal transduction histidine kinase